MNTTVLAGNGRFAKELTQVDQVHSALRTCIRPNENGLLGSFRVALKSGVIAAGMTGPLPVWEFRWGTPMTFAIVKKLRIQALVSTTAFAAGAADSSFSLFRAQGFTALDGTGATLAAFTKAKANALSTRFESTLFSGDTATNRTEEGGVGILNTANTGMTGGTKVLDDNALSIVMNRIVASAAAETIITPEPAPYMIDPSGFLGVAPQELYPNEGLVLQCDVITATGTWRLGVEVEWDEYIRKEYFE